MQQVQIHIENLSKNYSFNKQDIIALQNINLTIYKDEFIGIIGNNGAGKTTLLKLISDITIPTTGKIELYGKVASFFDIGFSFHPDLSGIDNVYFIAKLMGFKQKYIKSKINTIIEYSEIGDKIFNQVKFYSRGMKIKLAFSFIAFIDADILLFDEISFLGEDISYRNKITKRLIELKKNKTILLVSHYFDDITNLCDKVIWLENGKINKIGEPEQIIQKYISSNFKNVNH